MRIINEASRFKQQLCGPLRHYPPLLKRARILVIETCLASGDKLSQQA